MLWLRPQDAKSMAITARQRGADYLASKYPLIADPYQLAITAYAMEVARHGDKDNAYIRLRTFNRSGVWG